MAAWTRFRSDSGEVTAWPTAISAALGLSLLLVMGAGGDCVGPPAQAERIKASAEPARREELFMQGSPI
jgi:hypothetical protein